MHLSELETPALVIDLDIMERNLARMAAYASRYKLRLRPHTKTHKIPALGRLQLDLGAAGLTVAKVGEAEVMLNADPPDLLVAYPVIGQSKLERLSKIAGEIPVTVSLDSEDAAKGLSAAAQSQIGVLVEVDVGLHRVGLTAGDDVVSLAKTVDRLPNLRFRGIAFYPGHIKKLDEGAPAALRAVGDTIQDLTGRLAKAGLETEIVSGGSTPTMYSSHEVSGMNEIRPGTYIFNDWNTVLCGACSLDDCAASIHTTVVSTAVGGQVIIDGGSKTFSSDRPVTSGEPTFGYLPDLPEARFLKMNEEHGFIETDRKFHIGDRIRVVPNHICVAMNLHERVYGLRDGEVEHVWRVEGRGKLQ